jgi:hypothetical protein
MNNLRVCFKVVRAASAFGQTAERIQQRGLELVEDFDGDTYCAVYTIRFK